MKLVPIFRMTGLIIQERLCDLRWPFISRKKYEQLQEDYKEVARQLFQAIISNRQLKEKLNEKRALEEA